jgi:hypothetical protein
MPQASSLLDVVKETNLEVVCYDATNEIDLKVKKTKKEVGNCKQGWYKQSDLMLCTQYILYRYKLLFCVCKYILA